MAETLPVRESAATVRVMFASAAILLLLSVGVMYIIGQRTLEATRVVSRQHVITGHIVSLLSTLKDAETGQRGFLLTGDQKYLEPYDAAVRRINEQFATGPRGGGR
jgi:CHASE3 domain sensor protein